MNLFASTTVGSLTVLALVAVTTGPAVRVQGVIPLYEGNSTTSRMPVGTNLGLVLSQGTYCPWNNLARCMEPWEIKKAIDSTSYVNFQNEGITFGTEGYPTGFTQSSYSYPVVARSWVNAKLQGRYPGGSYTLTFTGTGTVSVHGDAQYTTTSSGSMSFQVSPTHTGIWIYLNATSPSNPVKNLVLVPTSLLSSVTSSNPYNPVWYQLLEKFDTFRTPHWQREIYNGYTTPHVLNWANRSSTSYFTYATAKGVPHEEIVALAKLTGKNVWISIPQFASDEYITQLANYYASELKGTSSKVFVEESNKIGYRADVSGRINNMKKFYAAFSSTASAFGGGVNGAGSLTTSMGGTTLIPNPQNQFQILITCDLLCAEFTPFLEPTNTKYDSEFRSMVAAVALPGSTWAGDEPWVEETPNPHFYKLQGHINDTYRVAREQMFYDETLYVEHIGRWALLNLTVYAKDGGVALSVSHYGHRFRLEEGHLLRTLEAQLESAFWNYEISNQQGLKKLWAEWLQRWYRMGGGLFMASEPLYPGVQCHHTANNESIQGIDRDHCNYNALVRYYDEVSTSNKLAGVLSFTSGDTLGAELLSSEGATPVAQACSASCGPWGACVAGSCLCDHGYSGADCSTFTKTDVPNNCMPDGYGMNLGSNADWSPVLWWSDFMKFSRNWVHQPVSQPNSDHYGWIWSYYDEKNKNPFKPYPFPELDGNGYPVKLQPNDAVGTFQRRDTYEYPQGLFHIFYEGEGTLTFGMDTWVVRRVRPGYIIVETKPLRQLNNGLWFQIRRTNPQDHLRNVKVIPDAQLNTFQGDPFHPLFIQQLQEYKVLRFMSVQNVGGSGTCLSHLQCDESQNSTNVNRTWSERTKPSYFSQVAGIDGMSIEYIVRLANRLHATPWISVPFNADDDYVIQQAAYIKQHLNPKLKPIIEYSNEVWANHHHVGFYAQDQGVKFYPGTSSDPVAARACWNQRRARQIWSIYEKQVGLSVTRVLAGQAAASRVLEEALNCEAKYGASAAAAVDWSTTVDVISLAPYLGRDLVGERGLLSLDDIFYGMDGNLNATAQWVADHKALATSHGIQQLSLYEAGPAFFGGAAAEDPDVVDLGRFIHSDPRIQKLIVQYFEKLQQAGIEGGTVAYFMGPASRWSQYGAFGIRQSMLEDPATSYKVKGYRQWANNSLGLASPPPASCITMAATTTGSNSPTCPGHGNCNAHGVCLEVSRTCICHDGWSGTSCETQKLIPDISQCNKYTCEPKGGSCQPTKQDGHFQYYTCVGCDAGWTGWHCHVPQCDSNCSWNGKCTAPGFCSCYRGFGGERCEIDCGCGGGHGDCSSDNKTCSCDPQYTLKPSAAAASSPQSPQQVCKPVCPGDGECLTPGIRACSHKCVFGSCWDGVCKCWSGFGGEKCSIKAPSNSSNRFSTMGINVAGIADWTSGQVFLNLMFRSRSWFLNPAKIDEPSTRWTLNEKLTLTRDGYPAFLPPDRVAGTFATRDTFNPDEGNRQYIPAGDYVLQYDGNGRLETGMDAQILEDTRSKGYMKVRYTPSTVLDNGFYIRIEATDPSNPLRNIRIYSPDFPHEAYAKIFVFHPDFYSELAVFRSIRFMPWVGLGKEYQNPTDQIHERRWINRKLPNDASMTTGFGVSEDHMISLCNWLNADPWFTIPHDSSDDYVTKFAQFLRLKLRPDVMIHIEHSNEVWNSHYESWKYAAEKGREFFGTSYSNYVAANMWHGKRSQEIFAIFAKVFGPLQFNRLQFKLGTFVLIPAWTSQSLAQVTIRPLNLAVTTYFCDERTFGGEVRAATLTTSQLVSECLQSSKNGSLSHLEAQRTLATTQGLGLDSYEGGPSLVQQAVLSGGYARFGTAQTYHGMHTSGKMSEIVPNFLTRQKTEGGVDMEMYFTSSARPSIYGSWGIKESVNDPCSTSSKCKATEAWIRSPTGQNATKRAIRWGMPEYGMNNGVKVLLDKAPTLAEINAKSASLESALNLPAGSVQAVFSPAESTTTARSFNHQSAQEVEAVTPSTEVFFIVTVQQTNTDAESMATVENLRVELTRKDGSSAGNAIGASSVTSASIASAPEGMPTIDPHAVLPAELQDPTTSCAAQPQNCPTTTAATTTAADVATTTAAQQTTTTTAADPTPGPGTDISTTASTTAGTTTAAAGDDDILGGTLATTTEAGGGGGAAGEGSDDSRSGGLGLIIGGTALAVVVIGAIVALIVFKKKKKSTGGESQSDLELWSSSLMAPTSISSPTKDAGPAKGFTEARLADLHPQDDDSAPLVLRGSFAHAPPPTTSTTSPARGGPTPQQRRRPRSLADFSRDLNFELADDDEPTPASSPTTEQPPTTQQRSRGRSLADFTRDLNVDADDDEPTPASSPTTEKRSLADLMSHRRQSRHLNCDADDDEPTPASSPTTEKPPSIPNNVDADDYEVEDGMFDDI